MNRLMDKINIDKWSLNLIMLTNCFLCLFEEVLEMHIIVVLLYIGALGLLICKRKITIVQGSAVLLLYVLGIFISIVANGTSFRALYRAGLSAVIVLYAAMSDPDTDTLDLTKRALVIFGLFNAAMVLLQFLLKDNFTDILYSLFNEDAQKEALFYYKRGYFAGLNMKPHETAGMISIAMAVLFTKTWENKRDPWRFVPILMFIPLLLTGKRAITVLVAGCALLLYVFVQLANRHWMKIVKIGAAALVVGVAAILLIQVFPEVPLFARFAKLFNGETFIDDTRLSLWGDAWLLFKENPLFGVGWSNFNELTVDRFNYFRSHSVNLDYLQWLCEGGIVGFSLMMTPVVFTFVRMIKLGSYAAKTQLPAKQRDLIFLAVYIQFFVLLYALVEVPFYNNLFFAYYIFSCIIINAYYPKCCRKDGITERYDVDLVVLKQRVLDTLKRRKPSDEK